MVRFLISALAIRNFKSSQGRVKRPTAVDAAMKCPSGELTWPARLLKSNRLGDNGDWRWIRAGTAGVKQAGPLSCSPSALPQARSSLHESGATQTEWYIAPRAVTGSSKALR